MTLSPPHPHDAFSRGFYRDDDFDFQVRNLLGLAVHGAADAGEVLATISAVGDHDHEAWFAAWQSLGSRLAAQAELSAAAGHPISAAATYLRAASYLGVAAGSVDGLADESVLLPTFHAHRAAWDAFVDTTSVTTERVSIPFEGTTLPGYLMSPSADSSPGRTLILVNGSDGAISSLWANAGVGAIARGYRVLLFDGPGQQTMLFDRGVPFRFDWEAVVTPVVEFLLDRADVDPRRIAAYGISQGGYWVPRALAFEHRLAAAIADPGVVDVAASWRSSIPKPLFAMVGEGKKEAFDRDMALGMKLSKATARTWNFRARPYARDSYFDTVAEVLNYNLEEVAPSITTPLLITSPDDEQFWPGQSQRLADITPAVSTLVAFTAAEGANFHCQPLARALTDERMFDWLDGVLDGVVDVVDGAVDAVRDAAADAASHAAADAALDAV